MSESQSRYGIVQELNNRKVNEKDKLANIEKETDAYNWERQNEISQIESNIKAKEGSYKLEHKQRQRELEVNLQLMTAKYEQKKTEYEESITDEAENFEKRFQAWKTEQEVMIASLKKNLARYTELQNKKIEVKKSQIEEIEKGIESLKEISADQKDDKKKE